MLCLVAADNHLIKSILPPTCFCQTRTAIPTNMPFRHLEIWLELNPHRCLWILISNICLEIGISGCGDKRLCISLQAKLAEKPWYKGLPKTLQTRWKLPGRHATGFCIDVCMFLPRIWFGLGGGCRRFFQGPHWLQLSKPQRVPVWSKRRYLTACFKDTSD